MLPAVQGCDLPGWIDSCQPSCTDLLLSWQCGSIPAHLLEQSQAAAEANCQTSSVAFLAIVIQAHWLCSCMAADSLLQLSAVCM